MKLIKHTSIVSPAHFARYSIFAILQVLIICFVRKGIEKIFSQRELKWLDDILPPIEFRCGQSTESLKTKEVYPFHYLHQVCRIYTNAKL